MASFMKKLFVAIKPNLMEEVQTKKDDSEQAPSWPAVSQNAL